MATPKNRARIYGGQGGGGGIDLAGLFGNIGGGEVKPTDVSGGTPVTDYPYDWSGEAPKSTAPPGTSQSPGQIQFKPAHPFLNILSGGQGSALASQENLEQVLQ